jgi:pyruvate/2-oxoglutarate dehydrogenase complex dihydrolipoamide acyltransferase (E2) component
MAHQVLVPPLGQTTDTVVFASWYKQVGDSIKQGEPLFAIETDKATLDIEAQVSGVLVETNALPGESVAALSEIGVIAAAGESTDKVQSPPREVRQERHGKSQEEAEFVRETLNLSSQPERQQPSRIFISPRARRLAEADGVQWQRLVGTGPEGAIVERDVRNYLAKPGKQVRLSAVDQDMNAAVQTAQAVTDRPIQSLSSETDMSALLTICARLKQHDVPVTHESLLLYVLAQAIREQLWHDGQSTAMGIAIILGTPQGFIAPVIKGAAHMRLVVLTRRLEDLKTRARNGKIESEELAGAMISFINLGIYRVDTSLRSAFLPGIPTFGIGRIRHHNSGNDSMWVNLSYQQGANDDLPALRLMDAIVELIEAPDSLL